MTSRACLDGWYYFRPHDEMEVGDCSFAMTNVLVLPDALETESFGTAAV
jgi:hypothetical protein